MDRKTWLQALGLAALLIGVFFAGYYVAPLMMPKGEWRANLFVGYELFSGNVELEAHNVVTDIGEAQIRNRTCINGTYAFFGWIGIGNATAGTGLTKLTSEYDRKLGTVVIWTSGGDAAFNVTYKWVFWETVNLNAAGNHWAGSGDNNMAAVANFPNGAQTFNANENMTVRWCWTFDAN